MKVGDPLQAESSFRLLCYEVLVILRLRIVLFQAGKSDLDLLAPDSFALLTREGWELVENALPMKEGQSATDPATKESSRESIKI